MYPLRDMMMKVALMDYPVKYDWWLRRVGLEHEVAWLGGMERVR
jgi:hypothetical protein